MSLTDDERIETLATQLAAIQKRITELKTDESDVKARIRDAIGPYRGTLEIGGRPVLAVTYRKVFSPEVAVNVLASNPDLLAACTEQVISATRAKLVLAPAIYEMCQVESAQSVITPKIGA